MNKQLTGPLSLAAAGLAVIVMAIWGLSSFTAPFEDDEDASSTTCGTTTGHTVKRSDITVSVYNDSKRSGLADRTMAELDRPARWNA